MADSKTLVTSIHSLRDKLALSVIVFVGLAWIAIYLLARGTFRESEETLRQSEERYRGILESIGDAYYEIDLEGKFTLVNDAACRHLGYSREELIGMNPQVYTDEATAKETKHFYAEVYKTGKPIDVLEAEYIRKDGTRVNTEVSVSLIRDSEGKPIGFRGLSRDTTERKNAQDALKKSEERYRNILDNIQDGYSEIDLGGNFTFVNNMTCKHLGYTKEELIGMNYHKYTNEENAKKIKQLFIELYKTGKPADLTDHELISKDGTTAIYELSVSLIRNAEGNPIGFRQTSRDITERKKTQEALKKSEEKYRTILENMSEAFCELDLAGNFTFVNESACQILGYTKNELMGMNNRQYTDKANAKRLFEAFNKVYRTGESSRGVDYEAIRKDGTKRYFDLSISL